MKLPYLKTERKKSRKCLLLLFNSVSLWNVPLSGKRKILYTSFELDVRNLTLKVYGDSYNKLCL